MIPIERARESRTRLEALGLHVAHAEYEMGHEISQQSLGDLVGWLEQNFFSR
jgi:predicted esterase